MILIGLNTTVHLAKGARIEIERKGRLEIGVHISYRQRTVLDIYNHGKLKISGIVSINAGSKVVIGKGAELFIGGGTYINEHSRIQCKKSIQIGENCAIAWNVNILDTDEHSIILSQSNLPKPALAPVIIGNHVWIGCNCTVLKGVTIGNECVIAAASVVTKSFGNNLLVAGNPAKAIKSEVSWK